jgi:hypothetical protein
VIRKDDRFSLWNTPAGEYWMATASGNALIHDLGEQERNSYGTNIHAGGIALDAGANGTRAMWRISPPAHASML